MQAGLVSKPSTFSDIFTARGSLRVFVALGCVSATVHLTESDAAQLPTLSSQPDQRTAAGSTANGASTGVLFALLGTFYLYPKR